MLESMVNNRRPTRAEVADVSNAILDGTDCIMLSEESASGTYPVEAVGVMTRIAQITEAHLSARPVREALTAAETEGDISVEDLISMSVHATVKRLTPTAVITPTETGTTPRHITRFRLPVWIAGVSAMNRHARISNSPTVFIRYMSRSILKTGKIMPVRDLASSVLPRGSLFLLRDLRQGTEAVPTVWRS